MTNDVGRQQGLAVQSSRSRGLVHALDYVGYVFMMELRVTFYFIDVWQRCKDPYNDPYTDGPRQLD